VLPEAAIAPILVFIGLEITAQGFLATPTRHAPRGLTFVPVAAAVVLIESGALFSALGASPAALRGEAALGYQALLLLGNGFILTAVLLGMGARLDHRRAAGAAALLFVVTSLAALFGVIHSPLANGALSGRGRHPRRCPDGWPAPTVLAALAWLAGTRARRITA